MTDKDITKITEEDTIETFEFTDDDGKEHCFVVESRFKVGQDDYVALLEVDPAMFDEGEEGCGCGHEHAAHGHAEACGCDHDHDAEETEEEELNIILAKIVTDEDGDIDIQVPSDAEFEKARIAYEALEA